MPKAPDLTRLTRKPDRGGSSRELLDALLDDELVCTLSTVLDGQPWVVPLLFARDGDRVLVHGSTGAGALRQVAAGAPVALCVTAIDGVVVAESTFESSANYRSAVLRGHLDTLTGDDEARALDVLSDRILPGRTTEVRPSTKKERSATLTLALPIGSDNWLYKERIGEPGDPGEPVDVWCGVVPIRRVAGAPEPAPWSAGEVPASVTALTERLR